MKTHTGQTEEVQLVQNKYQYATDLNQTSTQSTKFAALYIIWQSQNLDMCEQRNQQQAIKAKAPELWRQAMNQATIEALKSK